MNNDIGKYSHKHGRLAWYQVILAQWVRGRGLSTIMYQAIKNKEDNPKNAMYIDREYLYHVEDYRSSQDFADDKYEEFYDYEDDYEDEDEAYDAAEDYWREHHSD